MLKRDCCELLCFANSHESQNEVGNGAAYVDRSGAGEKEHIHSRIPPANFPKTKSWFGVISGLLSIMLH